MAQYLYCGQTVVSNIALPELPRVSHKRGDFSFSVVNGQKHPQDTLWTRYWLSPDGEKAIFYHKKDHFDWLRFPGLADFCISEDAKEIVCYPSDVLRADTIRHLLLDQVLPRCIAHQGKLVLHASTVWLKQGALIFIGSSGAGKSTLAADFYQADNQIVSDDCVWVREDGAQIKAIPSYFGLRLWEDSLQVLFASETNIPPMAHYSSKKRISLTDNHAIVSANGISVLAVMVLSPLGQSSDPKFELNRIPLREGFIEIANESFQLDSFDRKERSSHMQILGTIVTTVPVYRLYMPHNYDLLTVARKKILQTVL